MRESLSERVSRELRGKYGDKSRRWKGMSAGYVAKHDWIRKHYGKASKCSFNPSHKAKRYEWANISGEYKRDISDYIELCPSCHRRFDRKNTCKRGHEMTPENTYTDPRGYNTCRVCRNEARERYKRRKSSDSN